MNSMSNERKLRLNQVAREFKVGVSSIAEFLEKKGIKIENTPNTLIDSQMYALLEKEFGSNRGGNPRGEVRERISQKPSAVSIGQKKNDDDFKEEVVIKSKSISVKDEVKAMGPKILGTIDLDGKKNQKPQQSAPTPAPKAEPKEAPKAEPKPVQPKVEKPAAAPAPAAPVAEQKSANNDIQNKTYDERLAESRDDIFRPQSSQLSGPNVIGTIDVSQFQPGGRHPKRKRITKDKVDVTKPQQGAQPKPANGNKPN